MTLFLLFLLGSLLAGWLARDRSSGWRLALAFAAALALTAIYFTLERFI